MVTMKGSYEEESKSIKAIIENKSNPTEFSFSFHIKFWLSSSWLFTVVETSEEQERKRIKKFPFQTKL